MPRGMKLQVISLDQQVLLEITRIQRITSDSYCSDWSQPKQCNDCKNFLI